jgi:hypothetical protein
MPMTTARNSVDKKVNYSTNHNLHMVKFICDEIPHELLSSHGRAIRRVNAGTGDKSDTTEGCFLWGTSVYLINTLST